MAAIGRRRPRAVADLGHPQPPQIGEEGAGGDRVVAAQAGRADETRRLEDVPALDEAGGHRLHAVGVDLAGEDVGEGHRRVGEQSRRTADGGVSGDRRCLGQGRERVGGVTGRAGVVAERGDEDLGPPQLDGDARWVTELLRQRLERSEVALRVVPDASGELGQLDHQCGGEGVRGASCAGLDDRPVDLLQPGRVGHPHRSRGLRGGGEEGVASTPAGRRVVWARCRFGTSGARLRPRLDQPVTDGECATADRSVDGAAHQPFGLDVVERSEGRQRGDGVGRVRPVVDPADDLGEACTPGQQVDGAADVPVDPRQCSKGEEALRALRRGGRRFERGAGLGRSPRRQQRDDGEDGVVGGEVAPCGQIGTAEVRPPGRRRSVEQGIAGRLAVQLVPSGQLDGGFEASGGELGGDAPAPQVAFRPSGSDGSGIEVGGGGGVRGDEQVAGSLVDHAGLG